MRSTVIIIIATLLGSVISDPPTIKKIIWTTPENLNVKDVEPAGNNNGGYDLAPVYIARGPVQKTGKIPGYILPGAGNSAKVGTGTGQGLDVPPDQARVLYTPRGSTSWISMAVGQGPILLPRNVILGGQYPKTRENLYICRANGEKVLPGFFQPSKKACVVWDGTAEKEFSEFEVLCINEYGMVSGAFM